MGMVRQINNKKITLSCACPHCIQCKIAVSAFSQLIALACGFFAWGWVVGLDCSVGVGWTGLVSFFFDS